MIAAGICTWQDGPALDACLASLKGHVDHVYLAHGRIEKVDSQGVEDDGPLWPTLAAKRDAILRRARADGFQWLLAIDADELLVDGHLLRPILERWPFACFPIPFASHQPPDDFTAAWKVLHVPSFTRCLAQSNIYELADGRSVDIALFRTAQEDRDFAHADGPWPLIDHRPDLRPEGRREIRYGPLEGLLEPPPSGTMHVAWWELPIAREGIVFYCPACGRSSETPGVCNVQHEPTVMVGGEEEPEVDPANGSEAAPAEQQAPATGPDA